MSDLLDQTLVHPISGEVIESDDLPAIKKAVEDAYAYLNRPEVKRMYQARDALQARLAELEPLAVPPTRYQTDRQQKVTRCPHCKTIIPKTVEALGEGEAEADREAAAIPPAERETSSPSPSAQAELLPTGPRTPEEEAALGIDIFGERSDSAAIPSPADVADQPSATTPEPEASEDSASGSPTFDPVEAAGAERFAGGKHVMKTVAQVYETDPDYLAYTLNVSKNEKLKAAIVTYQAHKEDE